MELFEHSFSDIRNYIEGRNCSSWITAEQKNVWPLGGSRNVVLSDEMAVELGSPQMNSVSCLMWTEHLDLVCDGKVNLIGPDIKVSNGKSLPFGKIVLLGVSGFDEENTYDKYKEMEAIRYSLDLKGYMMRAASQYQREWSRISKDALKNDFSFDILGGALRNEYLKKSYVHAVEFLFVTSSAGDVNELKEITKNVSRTINAMDKMINEIDPDCDEFEYNDVCDEVGGLQGMRRSKEQKKVHSNG
jgi:CO dehydrogenase/acetyl-CoA synthase beta subunit